MHQKMPCVLQGALKLPCVHYGLLESNTKKVDYSFFIFLLLLPCLPLKNVLFLDQILKLNFLINIGYQNLMSKKL